MLKFYGLFKYNSQEISNYVCVCRQFLPVSILLVF